MVGEQGTVIAVDAHGASVDVGGEILFCRVRGRLYEERAGQKRPIAPGDLVTVERTTEGEGVVEEVHPRRTRLSRKAAQGELEQVIAANVDRVAIVVSTRNPPLRPGLIDRLIIAASNRGVEPFIVVNKIDLGREKKVEAVRAMFTDLGYEVVLTSATEGWGVDILGQMLEDRTTVFAGHSGVGKSSLLNAVDPELHLKVGEVSHATSKGRHTTTRTELLRLAGGGFVVDTPGIRAFGIWDVERADLDIFFKEFEPLIEQCRFYDCTHEHEPDCAVRAALEKGELNRPRYEAYLRILDTLEE